MSQKTTTTAPTSPEEAAEYLDEMTVTIKIGDVFNVNKHPSLNPEDLELVQNLTLPEDGEELTFSITNNGDGDIYASTPMGKEESECIDVEDLSDLCVEVAGEIEALVPGFLCPSAQPIWTEWENGFLIFNYELEEA